MSVFKFEGVKLTFYNVCWWKVAFDNVTGWEVRTYKNLWTKFDNIKKYYGCDNKVLLPKFKVICGHRLKSHTLTVYPR